MGRQPANTKVGEKSIRRIRVRGGNYKFRALRLDHGNFSWVSEAVSRRTRIFKVVYNATSNELVRTNTLVKSCIVQVDATPYKIWYRRFYNVVPGETKEQKAAKEAKAKEQKAKKITKKTTKKTKKGDEGEEDQSQKKDKKKESDKKHREKRTTHTVGTLKQYKRLVKALKAQTRQKAAEDRKAAVAKATEGDKKGVAKGGVTKKNAAGIAAQQKGVARVAPRKENKKVATVSDAKKYKIKAPAKPDTDSKTFKKRMEKRNKHRTIEPALEEQFKAGRLYARITSRPGQIGRADGIILEGDELSFYLRRVTQKKKK